MAKGGRAGRYVVGWQLQQVAVGEMIRLLVADDHVVVREGLVQLLSSFHDLEVVGSASDGREAVAMTLDQRPDVVLMDLKMPTLDGVGATKQIIAAGIDTRVVILTALSNVDSIRSAIHAGAVGYLLKDSEPSELLAGIHAAYRGECPLAPKVAREVISIKLDETDPTVDLSEREREVLILVAKGMLNKQIARRLDISEWTVKGHLTNLFRRLNVSDRTQAALLAERMGLVDNAERESSPQLA